MTDVEAVARAIATAELKRSERAVYPERINVLWRQMVPHAEAAIAAIADRNASDNQAAAEQGLR
jgi:hypothetical protein